ncbi:pyridoxamine 5'-phosphate oxidase family protein [Dyadobacter subterraneus]|uniref:Pyridoxamine 5'-phosphate oxidase family protein n=1 Tax=Dyadobacter subterraneus TaxID=2773304 RepID=A0ABR9WED3_9BACT|nr:pyridoxamine 5'-phosphate oxidase family protein [Dyadobacter subterraneus]MBE9463276.1 pyridoxamine 5'-phosphate oxidase family protein [Dyadobacter subterraneus]
MNYSALAFTDDIKAIQERMGSRGAYERVEKNSDVEGLTAVENRFIAEMDSFYMASFGNNGFPYVQHRGGPKGFIKVIDKQTIGIVDFSGNRQYISIGNIVKNPNVSLILLSYPLRARLKLYAQAEVVEISENPFLFDLLKPQDYKFKPERLILFHIKAYDWNCPQHITPKYSLAEIKEMIEAKDQYILKLEQEVAVLQARLNTL